MSKPIKMAKIIGASFLAASSAVGQTTPQAPLQNTQKAVEYFSQELDFKTNPHGVKAVLEGREKNVIIVDVRSAKDYAKGHIPGAINIPWEKHEGFEGAETEFPELSKNKYAYVYCYQLLCNLGQKAAKKFASLGYPVKEIVGGFDEWKKEGNPVEAGQAAH